MTSTDDPDRDRTPTSPTPTSSLRLRTGIVWTPAARKEFVAAQPELSRTDAGKIVRQAARATLAHVARTSGALDNFSANLPYVLDASFVSDEEMREYNLAYRGKNKPTDVLSFAQYEGEIFMGGGPENLLGDLVIAVGTASRQGDEQEHGFLHEVCFLAIHGVLHLCGYDHDTAARRRVMFQTQDEIFEALSPFLPTPSCSSR